MKTMTPIAAQDNFRQLLDARRRDSKAVIEFEEWKTRATKQVKSPALALTDEEINRLVHKTR